MDDFIIKKAFDRYFSVGHANRQKSTGLGLTLVKQVVELHGGTATFGQFDESSENWVKVVLVLPNA